MNARIFAVFDQGGRPRGFYPSDVHPIPPAGAIEISHDDWREFLDYQGRRRWDGQKVVECEPATAPTHQGPAPPEVQKLGAENQKMNEAIVAAVRAWAGLESALAHILGTIITQGGGTLGMALYHRPSATETRIAIVDEAITHFCAYAPHGEEVRGAWVKLLARIQRCKRTRNEIIHGNVVTHWANGTNYLRLTAPIFDTSSKNRDLARVMENVERARRGDFRVQLPGMSVNDVQNAANNFAELSGMADELRLVFSHMQRTKPEPEAFRKKFQTLIDHLKKGSGHPEGDQIPPEP